MAVTAPPPPSQVEIDDGVIEEARRRQRRRRMRAAGLLVAVMIVGGSLGLAIGGGRGSGSAAEHGRQGGARPSAPARGDRIAGGGDHWARYETNVMPGSGVQLGSPRIGFALSGEPTNGFDDNLHAPGALIIAWPSPTVLVSRDGGHRWQASLSAPGGFWGLSVLDSGHAWAVGVTRLYRTVDGGLSWQQLAEPRKPLVRVAFPTRTLGFGLTVSGQLVESRDAGSSWQPSRWPGQGVAVCAQPGSEVLVATQSGAIWRSANDGLTWLRAATGLKQIEQFFGWPTDLSCQGPDAVEFSQAFCAAACGGGFAVRVRQSIDGGRTWRTIARQNGWPTGSRTQPVSANSVLVSAVASGSRGACLAGASWPDYPNRGRVQLNCTTGAGQRHRTATVPRLPFPARNSTTVIQGLDFVTASTGWLMVDEANAGQIGTRQSQARTEIWVTHDRGSTWERAYISPPYHEVWCTKLHNSACWQSASATRT